MYVINILLIDQNHAFILGLSSNLLLILKNFNTSVGITHRGNGFKFGVYVWLVTKYMGIGNKLCCGGVV